MTRSTADAYAAFSAAGGRPESDAQIAPVTQTPPAAGADEQEPSHDASPASEQSPVAARWPDSTGFPSAAIEPLVPSSFAVAAATPEPTPDAASAGSEAPPPATAEASSAAVSLQMLLLAAFGALAFSGLIGGAIYVARARRRPQSDDATGHWPGWSPPDDAYRLYALVQARAVNSPRRAHARPVDRLTSGLTDNGQEIAQLLARFADQAEAERRP